MKTRFVFEETGNTESYFDTFLIIEGRIKKKDDYMVITDLEMALIMSNRINCLEFLR